MLQFRTPVRFFTFFPILRSSLRVTHSVYSNSKQSKRYNNSQCPFFLFITNFVTKGMQSPAWSCSDQHDLVESARFFKFEFAWCLHDDRCSTLVLCIAQLPGGAQIFFKSSFLGYFPTCSIVNKKRELCQNKT